MFVGIHIARTHRIVSHGTTRPLASVFFFLFRWVWSMAGHEWHRTPHQQQQQHLVFPPPLCQNKGAVGGNFGIGVGRYQAGMNGERGGRHTEEDGVHHWTKKGWKGLAWHGTAYLGQVGWERVMRNHSSSGKQESSSSTIPPFALIPPFFLFLSTSSFLVMTWNTFFSQQSFQSLQFKP